MRDPRRRNFCPRERARGGGGGGTFIAAKHYLDSWRTIVERETGHGSRAVAGVASTVEKRKFALKFQGDASVVAFPADFHFPSP